MAFKNNHIAVAGAGFSGAVIARALAEADIKVAVFEERRHVGGNCHTFRDDNSGILIHAYGPHIFHTSDRFVWDYIGRFGEIRPFINRVKAIAQNKVFSLPINLMTINSFFGQTFSPQQAKEFLSAQGKKTMATPETFEDQALMFLGQGLYEAFFKHYTEKQWGVSPKHLPASILKRLPIRFNYNDNYYDSEFQGMPVNGYTKLIESILDHPNISVSLQSTFSPDMQHAFQHVFYSGPLDRWFDYSAGRLDYRTLTFAEETHTGDFQGNPVINYCDASPQWTRITEHKHFAPWETHDKTIIFKEFSHSCQPTDIPYYPLRLAKDKTALTRYIQLADTASGITFVGRLGTYRYLDMHVCIRESLNTAQYYLEALRCKRQMPAFIYSPIDSSLTQSIK